MNDLDARHRCLDDERRDLLPSFAVNDLVRRSRHHHEQLGARSIGAPQLLAVDDEASAVLGRSSRTTHIRGVRACIDFSQCECRDGSLGEAREELSLLFFGAEEFEGLWNADRLVCGQQRRKRSVLGGHHLDRADVAHLRQAEPAVFDGDLDAEGAHVAQLLHG